MNQKADDLAHPEYLVETDWLEAHLDDADLRIFDCTVHLIADPAQVYRVESGRPDWAAGHIPGAGFLDLPGELSDADSPYRFTMPSAQQFAAAMSRQGIGPATRVVLYSAGPNWWATRLWWMLRAFGFDDAAVLNGGLEKWRRENRPLSTAPQAYPPAEFRARPRRDLIAAKADVLAAMHEGNACIVNALSPRQHSGESDIHYGRPGRIAGSVNVPATGLLDRETNAFLPATELAAKLDEVGADGATRVIAYCGGGIAASAVCFAMALLGRDDFALYDNSLSEWVQDPALPMEAD